MPTSKNKQADKQFEEFRAVLLERRAVLLGDVNHMQDSALKKSVSAASGDLSTVPYHMADVGTDNYDHEFTLGLIENEEVELREIDEALDRLDKGTYGACDICKKPIPKSRLKIIPYARLCIECKRDEETAPTP